MQVGPSIRRSNMVHGLPGLIQYNPGSDWGLESVGIGHGASRNDQSYSGMTAEKGGRPVATMWAQWCTNVMGGACAWCGLLSMLHRRSSSFSLPSSFLTLTEYRGKIVLLPLPHLLPGPGGHCRGAGGGGDDGGGV